MSLVLREAMHDHADLGAEPQKALQLVGLDGGSIDGLALADAQRFAAARLEHLRAPLRQSEGGCNRLFAIPVDDDVRITLMLGRPFLERNAGHVSLPYAAISMSAPSSLSTAAGAPSASARPRIYSTALLACEQAAANIF